MPRFDLFTPIHKALRAMIYETGGALQTADFADDQGARRAAGTLRRSWGRFSIITTSRRSTSFPWSARSRKR